MAKYGSIGEYDPDKEEWTPYVEQLQDEYLIANDVEDETKKRAILLSSCGHSTYQMLSNRGQSRTWTFLLGVTSSMCHCSTKILLYSGGD